MQLGYSAVNTIYSLVPPAAVLSVVCCQHGDDWDQRDACDTSKSFHFMHETNACNISKTGHMYETNACKPATLAICIRLMQTRLVICMRLMPATPSNVGRMCTTASRLATCETYVCNNSKVSHMHETNAYNSKQR